MASLSRDERGNTTIQFFAGSKPHRRRRTIRLTSRTLKEAEAIKAKIEQLNADAIAGQPWKCDTAEWVKSTRVLDAELYDRLAALELVPPRPAATPTTLAAFLDAYIAGRTDVKPNTCAHLKRARNNLVAYFGADRPLREISPGEADEFRRHLLQTIGDNTVRRVCGRAKQFFRAAERKRLILDSPFADMKGTNVRENKSREYFLTQADAEKVLENCIDDQWRLLFVLSRYGGLRTPSEHLALTWADVDWVRGRVTVRSPKTAHHEGKESRIIPLFPELRVELQRVADAVNPGIDTPLSAPIITQYRDTNSNLRTQFTRIIRAAGLKPWPKLFQNLRSTRETELAALYPMHVICAWMGNSQPIAARHYLQVTDADFDRAADQENAAHALQAVAESRDSSGRDGNEGPTIPGNSEIPLVFEIAKAPRGVLNSNRGFVELGTYALNRLRRKPTLEFFPWNVPQKDQMAVNDRDKQGRDPLRLARYYESLLNSGKFESRAALARFLGVSRSRVTQVLNRLRFSRQIGQSASDEVDHIARKCS